METKDQSNKIKFVAPSLVLGLVLALLAMGVPMIGITVNLYLGAFILLVAFILLAYGFWRWETASHWGIVARVNTLWVLGIVYFSLIGVQIFSQYRKDHPRVSIASIPKPDARLVVPQKQPAQPALVIPPNTKIEATTNAPNSMAAGINTGTMIQGDPPPQFRLTPVSENTHQNGSYTTQFELQVTTRRAIVLHLKAIASSLVGDLNIDNKRPAEEGGMSFNCKRSGGAGHIELDCSDIESATYIITMQTSQSEKVQLQYY